MSEINITDVGFEWGSATFERISESKDGTVHMHIVTPKYKYGLDIMVSETGHISVSYRGEEWGPE